MEESVKETMGHPAWQKQHLEFYTLLVRRQDGYNLSSLGSLSGQQKELARAPVLGPKGHPFYF